MRRAAPPLPAPRRARTAATIDGERYPYHSPRFNELVAESYRDRKAGEAESFYTWMADAYRACNCRFPGTESVGLEELLAAKRRESNGTADPAAMANAQMALCAWLHKLVKTLIPHFSFDEGFEFCNVVKRGERQCFLQSVLIAGLLQRMGVDAGVVMVYKNPHGEEMNNGHAVTLVKLAGGEDILVDASEDAPFPRQQGLFARCSDYRYVVPVYEGNSPRIRCYQAATGNDTIETARLRALDFDFIRSQFWYYRGERIRGGLLSPEADRTREGLEATGSYLRSSIEACPSNPLPVYMLGRLYLKQGKIRAARAWLERALKLYSQFGWVPVEPRQCLDLVAEQLRTRARR